jgi:short-subunit dehydrogenase
LSGAEKLQGETALITGSSRGLGKELSLVFARNGFDIILHGRNARNLNSARRKVLQSGVCCTVIRGDLRQDKTINRIFKIANAQDVSILINNAALRCPHLPLEKIHEQQIEDILSINLVAQIKLTKRIYGIFLKKGRGTIININSFSGLMPQHLRSVYCASKWGLRGFAASFGIEARKNEVRIINIYPSTIKTTPTLAYGMDPKEVAEKVYTAYENRRIKNFKIDGRRK